MFGGKLPRAAGGPRNGRGFYTLSKWVRLYREQGEAGLQPKPRGPSRPRSEVAPAVKTQVVELKRQHPDFGIKKITQFLSGVFPYFLKNLCS